MTKRERVEKAHGFGIPDRPPFVPAVYEHKAALLGRTLHATEALLVRARLAFRQAYEDQGASDG